MADTIQPPQEAASLPLQPPAAPLRLALLVLLADLLFWRHAPGLSLALFALAIFAAALRGRPGPAAMLVLALAVLPVIEAVQALSLAFLALGLTLALALQSGLTTRLPAACLGLLARLPIAALRDLRHQPGRLDRPTARRGLALALQRWSLPLGGLLLLSWLLTLANPVLDHWMSRLSALPFDPMPALRRALFWTGVALLCWPLIRPLPAPAPPRQGPWRPTALARFGLNPGSVTRALILFNAALALQSLLDARYLWQGITPPGMTLAAYAHRGAYPLLATALLAGAFALAARPFAERPALRAALYLWLGQNILLTASALYRLELYVQSFGLTYLRIRAAIWMALVAIGLCLTLWQVARNLPARWLLTRCAALAAATLYLCAFVNFADLIARTNIAMGKNDTYYLCYLGPTAAAAIPATLKWPPGEQACNFERPAPQTWRDWGFRNWRVLHNLRLQEALR